MTTTADLDADRALKAKHRAMWALGDYPAVAAEVIPATGPALAAACGIKPGDRVLDVAAGSGNASVPAALAGGQVIASDLTPELSTPAGRRRPGRGRDRVGRGRRRVAAVRRERPSTRCSPASA